MRKFMYFLTAGLWNIAAWIWLLPPNMTYHYVVSSVCFIVSFAYFMIASRGN